MKIHPLGGKVALITGGSSGIGRATALRLGGDGGKGGGGAPTPALAVPTDVTDAAQCRRAVESTVDRFGRLDILICSAGLSLRGYFAGSDLAALDRIMRVNFFGTLYATHYALPHVRRTRGSLVALSSLTGKRGVPSYAV